MKGAASSSGGKPATARTLASAALVVTVCTVISKLLGFGREAALAAVFGASYKTDAFVVATNIPNSLFSLLGAALTAIAVPVFTEYLNRPEKSEEYARLLWGSFHAVTFLALVLATLGSLLAEPLTRLVAPGFSPVGLTLAIRLSRVMMFLMVPLAISGWATGVLHSYKHFLMPAAIGIPMNIVMIAAILLAGKFGDIYWLAWASLLATATQAAIQLPPLLRRVPRYRLILDPRLPGLMKMARLAVPVLVGVGVNQINLFVDRMLASGLEPGSISSLNYAQKVVQLPYGLLGLPVITVLYPKLATHAARDDLDGLRRALNRGLTALALVMVPVTVGMVILREDLMRFLFERGAFTPADTQRTAAAFLFYGLGLLPMVWRDYLTRASYALQDSRTPLWTGLVSTGINIVLNLALVRRYGLPGLTFSTAVSTLVNCLFLLGMLRRRLGALGGRRLIREGVKLGLAAAPLAVFLVLASPVLVPAANTSAMAGSAGGASFVRLGAGLVAAGVSGGLLYGLVCWALRVQEIQLLLDYLLSMVRRALPFRKTAGGS